MLGVLSSVSFGMDIDKECKGDPICYKAYKDVNNFAVSKDNDLDFKSFLFFCATGQDKKGHYERYKSFMKKLSNSDNPFQLLDRITYPSEYGTPINDGSNDIACNDAYQIIKANYWQKYRTHKAMAKFVNDTLSSHVTSASIELPDVNVSNDGIDIVGIPPVNFPTEEAVDFAIELAMESYEEELVAFGKQVLSPQAILNHELPKLSADLQQLSKLLSDIDLASSEPLPNIKEK